MELDELDRKCAEAMGFIVARWGALCAGSIDRGPDDLVTGLNPGIDPRYGGCQDLPRPTRSWEDFGALLLWCAEKGLAPSVSCAMNGSKAWLMGPIESESVTDPRVALCMAVAAWKESK